MHSAIVHTNYVGHQEVTARRFYGFRASGSPEASMDTFKKLKVKTSEDQPPPSRFVGTSWGNVGGAAWVDLFP